MRLIRIRDLTTGVIYEEKALREQIKRARSQE